MYDALQRDVKPLTRVYDSYEVLIREDRAMTRALQEGRLTREARAARLDQIFSDIRAAEAGAVAASDQEAAMEKARQEADLINRVMSPMRR